MDFIIISTMDFNEQVSAKQYALKLSSLGHKVLYINTQRGIEHILLHKNKKYNKKIDIINQNLVVYTPPLIFSLHNLSISLNYLEQWLFSLFIKKIIKKLDFKNYCLLIYQHNSYPLIKFLNPYKSLYVVIDEFVEIASGYRKKIIKRIETNTIKKSDKVLVASEKVLERIKKIRNDVILFPSAVDTDIFKFNPETEIKNNEIGIVSSFDNRIDYDLLNYIIQELSDYNFNIIGSGKHINKIIKSQNVIFHNKIPYSEIPEKISEYKIMLMPYKINKLTNSVSSLKLIEYLSLKKNIISTEVNCVKQFKQFINISNDKKEWVSIIRKIKNPIIKNEIKNIIKENSYSTRIKKIFNIIKK